MNSSLKMIKIQKIISTFMLDKFDLLSHDSLTMPSSLKSISFSACRVVIQIHSPKEIKLYPNNISR